jgi:hypothetical protein
MRAYVESSVVLRAVLAEPGRLAAWSRIEDPMTSEITRVECLRTLDRLRLAGGMPDRELARRRATALKTLEAFEMIRLNRAVLDRAAEPFPTLIRRSTRSSSRAPCWCALDFPRFASRRTIGTSRPPLWPRASRCSGPEREPCT